MAARPRNRPPAPPTRRVLPVVLAAFALLAVAVGAYVAAMLTVLTRVAHPVFNGVFRARLETDGLDERIAATKALRPLAFCGKICYSL